MLNLRIHPQNLPYGIFPMVVSEPEPAADCTHDFPLNPFRIWGYIVIQIKQVPLVPALWLHSPGGNPSLVK